MSTHNGLSDLRSYTFLTAALSEPQKLYVEARCAGSMPVVAARLAGYAAPDEMALIFEQDPTIKSSIEAGVRIRARQQHITREDVVNMLLDAYRNAQTASEMVKATVELAKICGHYAPQQVEVTHKLKDMGKLTDAELLELAGKDAIPGEYRVLDFTDEELNADVGPDA